MNECKIIIGKETCTLTSLCKNLGKSRNTVLRVFSELMLYPKHNETLVVDKRSFELFCMKLLKQDIKFIQKIVEYYFSENKSLVNCQDFDNSNYQNPDSLTVVNKNYKVNETLVLAVHELTKEVVQLSNIIKNSGIPKMTELFYKSEQRKSLAHNLSEGNKKSKYTIFEAMELAPEALEKFEKYQIDQDKKLTEILRMLSMLNRKSK